MPGLLQKQGRGDKLGKSETLSLI